MIRITLAVILGYVAMVILVVTGIALCWYLLGSTFAFEKGTNQASLGWSLINLFSGLLAAIVGGWVAATIAREKRNFAIKSLLTFIIAFGLFSAMMQLMLPPSVLPEGKTIHDLSFAEAGEYARSPTWYNFTIILVGVFGILIGSKLAKAPVNMATKADPS